MDNRRSKDSAVTVSVVLVQIFHERINLRPFPKKKRKKKVEILFRKIKKFVLS